MYLIYTLRIEFYEQISIEVIHNILTVCIRQFQNIISEIFHLKSPWDNFNFFIWYKVLFYKIYARKIKKIKAFSPKQAYFTFPILKIVNKNQNYGNIKNVLSVFHSFCINDFKITCSTFRLMHLQHLVGFQVDYVVIAIVVFDYCSRYLNQHQFLR